MPPDFAISRAALMRPAMPPEASVAVIFCTASNCVVRRFTSFGVVPEPVAMRRTRPLLKSLRSLRSAAVIEWTMPSRRSNCLSSMLTSLSALPTPGSRPSSCFIGPMRRNDFICDRKSSMVSLPFASFSAIFSASSSVTSSRAFSTSATTSPMPRMRPAMRLGLNSSSASNFSPVPRNLIGAPVTLRTVSAAPPRVSLSSLVRITPSTFSRSWNAFALRTASWPVIASTTSRIW